MTSGGPTQSQLTLTASLKVAERNIGRAHNVKIQGLSVQTTEFNLATLKSTAGCSSVSRAELRHGQLPFVFHIKPGVLQFFYSALVFKFKLVDLGHWAAFRP